MDINDVKHVNIDVEVLRRFTFDVFCGLGVPEAEARVCTDVLITADLRGIDSHGIGRLSLYYDRIKAGIQKPVTDITIVKETETTATIDGGHGMGHFVAYKAMRLAIDKARMYGMGSSAVRNSTHFGIAGYYALMAVEAGMVGVSITNARPSIPPTFGVEPMYGTNPLTFGAPTDEPFPFLIDCATSISQRGKIELLDRAGKPTPEGWAIDAEGKPHTETKKLLKDLVDGTAALLPMGGAGEELGGHKGYGWAIMIEILSAALQDGAFLKGLSGYDDDGNRTPYRLGHFFAAINIENFLPLPRFKKTAGEILRRLRNSKKEPGQQRIYTAGEKEYETEVLRKRGGIPVNENLMKQLVRMKEGLGLSGYDGVLSA
ncbi:MAG: Ldh family oxidoreductase [Spirochaetales bacterium]|nr:Ldh family oxidoreductase [Spirochaetales bacterium]